MTRETKIGLLVGLAFILVVGILLSEHVTRTTEAPQATLVQAGDTVRQAVRSPGSTTEPPITTVVPREQAQPQQTVPTQRELERPVVVAPPVTPDHAIINIPANTPRTETPVQAAPPSPWDALERAAAEQGVQLAPVVPGNNTQTITPASPTANRTAPPAPTGTREYTAEPGDNLHKIAQKVMGASTKANRDAIVRLNPSLQANPDAVIVGQKYLVPAMPGTAAANNTTPANTAQPSNPRPPAAPSNANVVIYEVRPGDSLWKIAVEQCGSANAIAQIRKLNEDTLKGDTVTVGMKLRLPKTDATARVDD